MDVTCLTGYKFERGHPVVYYQICIIYNAQSTHNIHQIRCNNYNYVIFGHTLILCFRESKYKSNETPTWYNTVQVLFLQGHSTCFGRKGPSSGVFKTSTAATVTCVIVAGKSSHLLIRAGRITLLGEERRP